MSTTAAFAVLSALLLIVAEWGARRRPATETWWGTDAEDALPALGRWAAGHHASVLALRGAASVAFLGAVAAEVAPSSLRGIVVLVVAVAVLGLVVAAIGEATVVALRTTSDPPPFSPRSSARPAEPAGGHR